MSRYVLRDDGYPTFKKITSGRKWVGRVCKIKEGYLGIIGKTEARAATERAAFDAVVAKHCGFDSVSDLAEHNRDVRFANNRAKAEARQIVGEMMSGNFLPFEEMLLRREK